MDRLNMKSVDTLPPSEIDPKVGYVLLHAEGDGVQVLSNLTPDSFTRLLREALRLYGVAHQGRK